MNKKMIKTLHILLLLLQLLFCGTVRADIFDRLRQEDGPFLDSAIEKDTSGFYYRSGVDYRPLPRPKDAQVLLMQRGSLGCSGFDFLSSFNNTFSAQAMQDYLKNMSAEAMAAAPMLLLEYVSPTLADIVKHFDSITNMRLGLRYAQCEDIEKAAGDYLNRLRKKSEMECIKSSNYEDIDTAIKKCKEQTDPFAFLKDKDRIPLIQGGKINVLSDALEKINANEETKKFILETIPETVITKEGVQQVPPAKTLGDIIEENRKEYLTGLEDLLNEYLETKEINQEQLKEFSTPSSILTEYQLKNIALLSPETRYIALTKVASELAFWKTLNSFEDELEALRKAIQNPATDDTHKDKLKEKYQFVKDKIQALETERNHVREFNEVMVTILEEADKERLRTLILDDGTKVIIAEEKEIEDKGLLLLTEE